jgi:hypothetical protein
MTNDRGRWLKTFSVALAAVAVVAAPARADEVWVTPSYQQDLGGVGIGASVVWPVTALGVVRLAWAVPNDLLTFQGAKIALIPQAPTGAATLNVFVCPAEHGDTAGAGCAGPFTQAFTGVANQLVEVEIGSMLASRIGTPGETYLAVLAYTTPTTTTDHIVGLRFSYAAKTPAGVATLAANTFTGTQTAPAFAGDGSSLTNLPFPAGAATLGANVFSGSQSAPAFVGSGAGLTGLPFPAGAATLGANTFNGAQTIDAGNLDLDASTATAGNITKNGTLFLHNFGVGNTFAGEGAGNVTTTSVDLTATGFEALHNNTTGIANTAHGARALQMNSTGEANTAVGSAALSENTTGRLNTAIGYNALFANHVGESNIAIGMNTLRNISNGVGNIAVGTSTMFGKSFGDSNTAIGTTALAANVSGSNNVAIGSSAGADLSQGSNNIYVGANVVGLFTENNAIRLGLQGTQTKTIIAGIRGTTTLNANAVPVVIDSAGQLGTISSSLRFKEDVRDMADASQRLLKLRPVTFRYTQAYIDGAKPIQYGLIAEEVADVFPELAVRDAAGHVETVHYETLNVLLVNEVQKQQRRIDALEQSFFNALKNDSRHPLISSRHIAVRASPAFLPNRRTSESISRRGITASISVLRPAAVATSLWLPPLGFHKTVGGNGPSMRGSCKNTSKSACR